MQALSTVLFAAFAQAAMVTLYSEQDCQGTANQINVWDDSCATPGGFQSFTFDVYGGLNEKINVYSWGECSGDTTLNLCASGDYGPALGTCFNAVNDDGGSNAIASNFDQYSCPTSI